jgi:hypothetical protein
MKPHFILACRITGLIICVYSILITLWTLPFLFFNPLSLGGLGDMSSIFGNSIMSRQLSQEMQKMSNQMWLKYLVTVILSGVLPFFFGIYLLKSARWFIHLAYPETPASEPNSQNPANIVPAYRPELDDRRYMPPSSR